MSIPVSTLKPGLLVHVSTSIKGNVKYDKSEEKVISTDGAEVVEWTTERTIKDPREQKLATEVKSKARNLVVSVCVPTEHGLLCPTEKRAELDAAFDKARALVADFNSNSFVTTLKFNALAGYIAPDDLTAVRAINGEIRDLLSDMTAGIEGLDVERVRDAANRAKKIGNMLSPEMQARIDDTIKAVRAQAKKLTEAGEQAATVIDAEVINKLAAARTAFLDIEDAVEVADAADTTARALDLAPLHDDLDGVADLADDDSNKIVEPAPAKVPELELG